MWLQWRGGYQFIPVSSGTGFFFIDLRGYWLPLDTQILRLKQGFQRPWAHAHQNLETQDPLFRKIAVAI
jgi:hypothetical protein